MSDFSREELVRYSRQMVLAEVGGIGQGRLRETTLTAQSEFEALFLAGAGIGTLRVPSEKIAHAVHAINPLTKTIVEPGATRDHARGDSPPVAANASADGIAESSARALAALSRVLEL